MLEIIIYIIFSVITFFTWITIHELTHIAAAKILGDVKEWTIIPYPHKYNGGYRFGGAEWTWDGEAPSLRRQGLVNIAPMASSTSVILGLTWTTFFLTGIAKMLMLIFCAGAVINLIAGSTGLTKRHDLRKGSRRLGINRWVLRISGMSVAAVGAFLVLYSLLA